MTLQEPVGQWEALAEHIDSGLRGLRDEIAMSRHELRAEITAVRIDMAAGFQTVHKKQDLTNGSVTILQLWRARIEGAAAATGKMGNIVMLMLLAAISAALGYVVPKMLGG